MERTINIDGKKVPFACSGDTVRRYRRAFRDENGKPRDLLTDMPALVNAFQNPPYDTSTLEIFENVAYIMARQADPTVPMDPDEWLDQFGLFSIYEVMPQIVQLWVDSLATAEEAKKNNQQLKES